MLLRHHSLATKNKGVEIDAGICTELYQKVYSLSQPSLSFDHYITVV